jgi:type IV secretion system protein TrbL
MGTGVGEMALLQAAGIGAATGAGTAALTGGDPLKGALIGGITGGAGHGFAGMGAAGGGAGAAGGGAGAATATEIGAQSLANPAMLSPETFTAPGAATGDLLSLGGSDWNRSRAIWRGQVGLD